MIKLDGSLREVARRVKTRYGFDQKANISSDALHALLCQCRNPDSRGYKRLEGNRNFRPISKHFIIFIIFFYFNRLFSLKHRCATHCTNTCKAAEVLV